MNLKPWKQHLTPNLGTILAVLALLLVQHFVEAAQAERAPSEFPSSSIDLFPYQGRLNDSAGNPVNGAVNMEFRFYNVPTGGTPLWEEYWTGPNAVQVIDGLFQVPLGSQIPGLGAVISEFQVLYLGITISADDEMVPRVKVGIAPYAIQALTVPDGAITTFKLADGSVTTNKLNILDGLQMTGNLVITGQITTTVNVMTQFATTTTDGAGTANIEAYLAVLKPAHYWMGCQSGETYWNTDYDFDYNATIGQLTNLPPNCKVVIYYLDYPEGDGNPVHSPPDW